uniref:V-set and transmembrane domain containing 4a n=1 Tax=Scophthalmus maximus TaxID=52904 RepID=A0A8D2ZTG1_SCOMX
MKISKTCISLKVCHTLNVTVNPGPVVTVTEKDNLTLSCLVSQRKRSSSVLILRWFFSPVAPSHFLIVKMGIKKMKLYGNYTRRFPQPKFRLYEETESELYRLRIFSVTGADQGFYACKVQEIRKHRNIWRASSNGTSTTQLTVHFTSEDGSSEGLWRLFADVYLCAVLICSLGLLSIFLFTLVLACQHLHRRHSSGETVTSSSSSSSSSPRAQRKDTRRNTDRGVAATPPKLPVEPFLSSLLSLPQPRTTQEDSLTYAELELVRPRPEPQASSSPDPTPASSDTVYAQILFQERNTELSGVKKDYIYELSLWHLAFGFLGAVSTLQLLANGAFVFPQCSSIPGQQFSGVL